MFTSTGRVIAYGSAESFGDIGSAGVTLDQPIISAVATPDGKGYYMAGEDGGIFAFGSARFHGSIPEILPGVALDAPVVGIVPSTTGGAYLLVASDGGIFTFGDAAFYGSVPGVLPGASPDSPVVGVIAQAQGYLMVAGDGGIFTFGSTEFFGSLGGQGRTGIVAVASRPDNTGYVMIGRDGGLYRFGQTSGLGDLDEPTVSETLRDSLEPTRSCEVTQPTNHRPNLPRPRTSPIHTQLAETRPATDKEPDTTVQRECYVDLYERSDNHLGRFGCHEPILPGDYRILPNPSGDG